MSLWSGGSLVALHCTDPQKSGVVKTVVRGPAPCGRDVANATSEVTVAMSRFPVRGPATALSSLASSRLSRPTDLAVPGEGRFPAPAWQHKRTTKLGSQWTSACSSCLGTRLYRRAVLGPGRLWPGCRDGCRSWGQRVEEKLEVRHRRMSASSFVMVDRSIEQLHHNWQLKAVCSGTRRVDPAGLGPLPLSDKCRNGAWSKFVWPAVIRS